jgi:hypothetical protein
MSAATVMVLFQSSAGGATGCVTPPARGRGDDSMTLDEWKAFAVFGLGVYALSFFSMNAALFLLVTVGIAAFVTRSTQAQVSGAATTAAKAAATASKKG